jgi:hypothetical protein
MEFTQGRVAEEVSRATERPHPRKAFVLARAPGEPLQVINQPVEVVSDLPTKLSDRHQHC